MKLNFLQAEIESFVFIKIYASDNFGVKLIRIWNNDDLSSNETIIFQPIMFSDTGHIAFIYQLNNHSLCCDYFAIFSKTGE
jgi:hypothetical protein